MPETLNGAESVTLESIQAHAARLEAEMASHCQELRTMLESEQALRNDLSGILDASSARMKRIQKALASLEGDAAPLGRPKKAASKTTWTVSQKKIDRTYDALVALGGRARASEITERAAQASESTRRALEKLREQERVRIVERSGRLGATFALMPDAPELEAVADAA